ASIGITHQRKGCDLARPMAGLAMLLQDRQHITIERRRLRHGQRAHPCHRRQESQAVHCPLLGGFGSSSGSSSRISIGSPSRSVRSRLCDISTPAVPIAAPAAPPRISPPVPPKMPPSTAPTAASVPALLPAFEFGPFTVPSSWLTFCAALPVAAVVALSEIGARPGSVSVLYCNCSCAWPLSLPPRVTCCTVPWMVLPAGIAAVPPIQTGTVTVSENASPEYEFFVSNCLSSVVCRRVPCASRSTSL